MSEDQEGGLLNADELLLHESSQDSLTNAVCTLEIDEMLAPNLRINPSSSAENLAHELVKPIHSTNVTEDGPIASTPYASSQLAPLNRSQVPRQAKLGYPDQPNIVPLPSKDEVCESSPLRGHAISQIESIFERMADELQRGAGGLTIVLKSRHASVKLDNSSAVSSSLSATRELSFPGPTPQAAWTFTVFVRILELIHNALAQNVVISKRDIFYREPALFLTQAVVDRSIDDIAFTLGVPRAHLNVRAAAKGLVAGNFMISRKGTMLDGTSDREGLLVPHISDARMITVLRAQWILVVEKEATFKSILSSSFGHEILRNGVVLTAKGYPDLSTRAFLRCLSDASEASNTQVPICFFVDWDPDGISIFATYAYGSKSLSHETAELLLPTKRMRYLGVRSDQLCPFVTMIDGDPETLRPPNKSLEDAVLFLTYRDRRKCIGMLQSSVFSAVLEGSTIDRLQAQGIRELQVMLMLGCKAEMQVLEELPGGIDAWLRAELHRLV